MNDLYILKESDRYYDPLNRGCEYHRRIFIQTDPSNIAPLFVGRHAGCLPKRGIKLLRKLEP